MDTICVSNIPDHYNEMTVVDIFSRYGKVVSVERMKNEPYIWHIKYNNTNNAEYAFLLLSTCKIDKKIMSYAYEDAWDMVVTMSE